MFGFLALGVIGIWIFFALAWVILQVVANWLIFQKAGEAGWKSLIPIYADYITFKISWRHRIFFWIWLLGTLSLSYSYWMTAGTGSMPEGGAAAVMSFLALAAAVISVTLAYKKSRAFGHGIPFALGLLFFTPLFTLILGFGSSVYYGPQD